MAWATMTRGGAYRQRPVTSRSTRRCQGARAERDDHRSNRRSGEPVEDSGFRSREPVWGWIADPIWASGHAAAPTGRTHDRYRPDCRSSRFFSCIPGAVHTCPRAWPVGLHDDGRRRRKVDQSGGRYYFANPFSATFACPKESCPDESCLITGLRTVMLRRRKHASARAER